MIKLFIDEAGSITKTINTPREYFFIIAVLHVKNERALLNSFKRFVRKNMDRLKASDKYNKMFDSNGVFIEMKGSALSAKLKKDFIEFICKDSNFTVYYVRLDNRKTNGSFIDSKERAFNYILYHMLEYNLRVNNLPNNEKYRIYLDQRSVAVKSLASLEDYLYSQFVFDKKYVNHLVLTYHESETLELIQVVDFFANILFASNREETFNEDLKKMIREGYLSDVYNFPFR